MSRPSCTCCQRSGISSVSQSAGGWIPRRELGGRESSALRVHSVWTWVLTVLLSGLEGECCVACGSVAGVRCMFLRVCVGFCMKCRGCRGFTVDV